MTSFKIISVVLKPVQIILLVAGLGAVAYFTKEAHDEATKNNPLTDPYDVGSFGRYEFFLYSTGVGVGIAVLGLVCSIMGLLEKKYGAFAMLAVQAIAALQLLVSTALLAKILTTFQKEQVILGTTVPSKCEIWAKAEDREYKYTCGQLTGGVVCGFIAMVFFGVDMMISFASFMQSTGSF